MASSTTLVGVKAVIERAEAGVPRVRRGGGQDKGREVIGAMHRPGQRDSATIGLAHDDGFAKAKLFGGVRQQVGLFGDRGAVRVHALGITKAGPVERSHAVAIRQLVDQREGEIAQVARGAVDQHDVGTGALAHVMDLRAVHVEKPADGRKLFFRLGFAIGRGAGRGQRHQGRAADQQSQSSQRQSGLLPVAQIRAGRTDLIYVERSR